jgi:hypothetical protein
MALSKNRNIQDCLSWAFEYLHMCHKSKINIIIIKIDFEKAFDKVEYSVILHMLRLYGFGKKWINWIKSILDTATTSVILNGVPGKIIKCLRGVRQGDPLSPLLFVLAAELLQIVINEAWQTGLLNLPMEHSYGQKYTILQYADDTLIIMPAEQGQLDNLKTILYNFSASTGLRLNYHKTSMVPVNTPNDVVTSLAHNCGCKLESLPFTYLGLPLGTTRPRIEDFLPIVEGIDRRLSGITTLLYCGSRLVVIKSVISSMPMFTLCALKIPFTILDHIEKSERTFLWYGKEIDKHGKCLISWDTVCLPK